MPDLSKWDGTTANESGTLRPEFETRKPGLVSPTVNQEKKRRPTREELLTMAKTAKWRDQSLSQFESQLAAAYGPEVAAEASSLGIWEAPAPRSNMVDPRPSQAPKTEMAPARRQAPTSEYWTGAPPTDSRQRRDLPEPAQRPRSDYSSATPDKLMMDAEKATMAGRHGESLELYKQAYKAKYGKDWTSTEADVQKQINEIAGKLYARP